MSFTVFGRILRSVGEAVTVGVAARSPVYSSTRSLWSAAKFLPTISSSASSSLFARNSVLDIGHNSNFCRTVTGLNTKGDQELVEFLTEEIVAETKSQKSPKLPKLDDFSVQTDGSAVTLTKKFKDETINIKFNVNHTVDAEVGPEDASTTQPEQTQEAPGEEMKSKPSFTVDLTRGGKTLMFSCSITPDYAPQAEAEADPEAYNDLFSIDEMTVYKDELKETTYVVSGDIMDGYLYDLLVNMLEERGISNEFVEKMIQFSTSYEHKLYINLLESIKSFVSGN